jgi:hypothetical protein
VIRNLEVASTNEIYYWIGLNLADLVLTCVALVFGAVETNYAMRVFGINGVLEMVVWKVVLVCGVLVFLGRVRIPYSKNENILYLVNRIMILVCVWNVVVLFVSAVRQ